MRRPVDVKKHFRFLLSGTQSSADSGQPRGNCQKLEGDWRLGLIFVLQQEIETYDTYQRRIAEGDQQLQKHLISFADTVPPPAKEALPPKKKKKQNKNNPHFHLVDKLPRITGVDLTRIDGVDVIVAQTLVSEVGLEMSRWETEAHFSLWLGLCPDNRISADKVLARGTRACGQSRGHGVADGRRHLDARSHLSRSAIPTISHQARCPENHYGDGPPARSAGLSNSEIRSAIHVIGRLMRTSSAFDPDTIVVDYICRVPPVTFASSVRLPSFDNISCCVAVRVQ
jgi:hypothetical protein